MSSLKIRTHKNDVIVEGLKTLPVTTEKEVLDYIKKGQERRHISATDFNAQSSRSHTIFQLIIESKSKLSSLDPVRLSKLNLIDLAGSEKVASDLDRRHEGSHINKSLLTLGKVITSLINGSSHIPYRDSKLTRILQTSLSGNARVAVVCTINPDAGSKEESMNTLRFAQNVKKIETRPVITRVTQHSRLQNYKEQIVKLQTQMQEKTEKEAETRERLSHLLGLILTSKKSSLNSKENKQTDISADDDDDESVLLSGSMEDVVYQCEQQLTVAIGKHQLELEEKSRNLENLEDRLTKVQKNLTEKNNMIQDLETALLDTQRINEEQSTQLKKYSKDIVALTKRWTEIETMVADYKERLIASEAKVVLFEARHEADEQIKEKLTQQLEDYKHLLSKNSEDEKLLDMVQSIQEENEENEDKDGEEKEGDVKDEDKNMIEQLNKNITILEQQLQDSKTELEKERDRNSIYSMKLNEVQMKLLNVENALKKSIADAEKEKQINDLQLKTQVIIAPTTTTPIQSLSRPGTVDHIFELIWRYLYLQNGSWVVLIAFAILLFI
ncbi:unnamed protein product [Cunninghamella echinulata]